MCFYTPPVTWLCGHTTNINQFVQVCALKEKLYEDDHPDYPIPRCPAPSSKDLIPDLCNTTVCDKCSQTLRWSAGEASARMLLGDLIVDRLGPAELSRLLGSTLKAVKKKNAEEEAKLAAARAAVAAEAAEEERQKRRETLLREQAECEKEYWRLFHDLAAHERRLKGKEAAAIEKKRVHAVKVQQTAEGRERYAARIQELESRAMCVGGESEYGYDLYQLAMAYDNTSGHALGVDTLFEDVHDDVLRAREYALSQCPQNDEDRDPDEELPTDAMITLAQHTFGKAAFVLQEMIAQRRKEEILFFARLHHVPCWEMVWEFARRVEDADGDAPSDRGCIVAVCEKARMQMAALSEDEHHRLADAIWHGDAWAVEWECDAASDRRTGMSWCDCYDCCEQQSLWTGWQAEEEEPEDDVDVEDDAVTVITDENLADRRHNDVLFGIGLYEQEQSFATMEEDKLTARNLTTKECGYQEGGVALDQPEGGIGGSPTEDRRAERRGVVLRAVLKDLSQPSFHERD